MNFNFLHEFTPHPILLDVGFFKVYWYGLFVVLGILAAIWLATRLARKFSIDADEIYSVAFYAVVCGLIGARVYSVFLDWQYYYQNPADIVAIWNGGLAIHGGIIGGVAAALFYAWKKDRSFWTYADIAAPAVALGQAIGRWGNYFNQEIFGTPTNAPWGIPIELSNRPLQYLSSEYFHPTFLYESLLNILNCIVLVVLFKKSRLKTGSIFLIYLANYAVIRTTMELFRTDPAPLVAGVRLPIIVSGVVFCAAISLVVYRQMTVKKLVQ